MSTAENLYTLIENSKKIAQYDFSNIEVAVSNATSTGKSNSIAFASSKMTKRTKSTDGAARANYTFAL